ncbi:unnamed protein product [Diabrotica balteata]|uniref:Uncharacterized protein n=1 Tax=Diabrotica balteata TaxID=107213 RepID=A0A9N9SU59_DIABA|nr:unnamed protein product [Diabrotica balteata]
MQLAQYNAQSKAATGGYMIIEPNASQNNYHQASQSSYPPPLLHMNGGLPRDLQNNYSVNSTSTQMVNQQPAHQSSRTQATTTPEERNTITNGRSMMNSVNRNNNSKLIQLTDAPTAGSNNIPYKVQKALVEGKMIPCINMKPNVWTDMLVSLPDLITHFFNNVPVQSCQQVLQVLGIEVYKANSEMLTKACGKQAMKKSIYEWHKRFQDGREVVEDENVKSDRNGYERLPNHDERCR